MTSNSLLAAFAYFVASLGPAVWALACWYWAARARRWQIHLTFLPILCAILWVSLRTWIVAMGYDDFEDSELGPGAAFPLVPVVVVTAVAVIAYLLAVVAQLVLWLRLKRRHSRG